MKSKISICFLTIVVILLALVMIEKINTQRAADNEDKNAKYCIKNDSGMLSVYNATASEKYFDTGVYFEELPDEAKNKVTNGLYFFNETDLYDFLESYSS